MHPNQIVHEAVAALEDFRRVNQNDEQQEGLADSRHEEKWKPPSANMIKINWDAAADSKKGIVGMGIIARDGNSLFLAAEAKQISLYAEPVVAETMVALHALIFCKEL